MKELIAEIYRQGSLLAEAAIQVKLLQRIPRDPSALTAVINCVADCIAQQNEIEAILLKLRKGE